ncbi:M61 family metallopeptidase [Candidatus Skiveiella danica]|jgi:predicted metalloprotease with PDZ domain|uniref:M61 family metallopeptidase n=1 Tax=Candidatus Skiveiella danica TaxID=3386177 RepID=UPI001D416EC2|nr:M61 family metallopeptidase [Comamonadaceae bacterium]MBK9199443.1 M61 family metallopeptidase [Betaproteobacteria bacterium]MBK9987463.1 M61 family metallopeptidase [Betaproteobacteria bacterium]
MPSPHKTRAPVHYRVEMPDLHTHLYQVTLTVPEPDALQRLTLPAWIPGSYLIREFAKNLQGLQARQGRRALEVLQTGKSSWEVACKAGQPLQLAYTVYANDASVRTAWLEPSRGFFNGTSLCLRAEGHTQGPHALEIRAPKARPAWSVATGLTALLVNAQGFGTYQAADYDELADCPFELGAFWSGTFKACGVPHRFVVSGATPAFDGARLLADTKKICETSIRFWHGGRKPPHKSYVFMLNAVDDSYGGLEHRNSTALICGRRDLPRLGEAKTSDGYTTLLGLISHEYFHTWNVKRLRPAEFTRYDYAQENYTRLLWFFEGFTSYYDDLLLRRAGLIDDALYLKLLNKTLNQVLQTPGRAVQSVAQASFDAWVKYYRQDENTPNATVSYYTKGALVALCLDLTLRQEGHTSLDAVMRALWTRCQAGPMQEDDLLAVLAELGGRDFSRELADWVHGTSDLPLKALLERHGVGVHEDAAQPAQRLGLRVAETAGIQVKVVLRGGAAERAGFAAGDEWLAVAAEGDPGDGWRLHKLEDLALYAGPQRKLTALVARDKRLLRLPLELPEHATTWRLALRDAAAVASWLEDAA